MTDDQMDAFALENADDNIEELETTEGGTEAETIEDDEDEDFWDDDSDEDDANTD